MGSNFGDRSVNYEAFFTVTNNVNDIVCMAAEKKADLLVSPTQPRLGLKRFLLGSITERLTQTLPFPLLFIRGPGRDYETSWKENIRFQRILVGCDFSADSILGLRYAQGNSITPLCSDLTFYDYMMII